MRSPLAAGGSSPLPADPPAISRPGPILPKVQRPKWNFTQKPQIPQPPHPPAGATEAAAAGDHDV